MFTMHFISQTIVFGKYIKGALDKCNVIPNVFQKKVGIFFIQLEVLAWVMTAC